MKPHVWKARVFAFDDLTEDEQFELDADRERCRDHYAEQQDRMRAAREVHMQAKLERLGR